ncbi:MAG: tRNA pseudouridine(55) synthase TruB [Rhodoluna sp.]|nr:tRNA pseudouridine(55) synthase TruB [Rhodoluna sp.]
MATPGLVLIDKPTSWTSHDVVAKVRKSVGTKKVGHAGTLDPLATGLLVLGIESGTKLLTFLVGADKTYEATIRLGQQTISDDSESEVISSASPYEIAKLSDENIAREIAKLTGVIMQTPSSVSAIKVAGKRAYDLVRAGEEVELKAREVNIYSFEMLSVTRVSGFLDVQVRVECSSGTYIRALARDLGNLLGVGGHITALRRTKVGHFDVSDANSIEELSELRLTELATAAKQLFPVIELTESEVTDLIHGKRISAKSEVTGLAAGLSMSGKLVAVLESVKTDLKSVVVFQGEKID